MTGPLAGLRVVEIGADITGPYCTKLLVDLGADVTKVEPPTGDPLRTWGPTIDAVGHSGLFEYVNAGKRGVTVDVENADDLDGLHRLIARADVLVESLPPGTPTTAAWQVDSTSLERINPRLVVVRISDFGRHGPSTGRATTPLTLQAASGWISERHPGRPPVQSGARIPEYLAGAYGALGALTALRVAAAGTGEVVEVDVSVFESMLSALPYPMLMAERMRRLGRRSSSKAAPMLGIVRAADGWIGINCLTGQHWLDVCAMMGLPEFGEHQLAIMTGGPERADFFAKAQPWLDGMAVADLVELSQAMRIPAAPVTDGQSISDCPQFEARGFFVDGRVVDRPSEPTGFRRPGAPFRLSRTPVADPRPAPRLGCSSADAAEADAAHSGDLMGSGDVGGADPALPFAGLKVFDLSTFWAGAYLTCYLGAFGADVVKVESIQRPDGHRFSSSLSRGDGDWYECGPLWQATNLNKRDVTLNLATERGRELALQLAAQADVVVENFSPRVVEQFGLDYDSLAELNPAVIMVRMPGFGLEGPWRDYVGWALNIEQLSGMSAATGYDDGPPCNLQGPADPIAGIHATVALLAALEHRRRTGAGQLIEVAQIEVGAAVTAEPVIEHSLTGQVPDRVGNRHRVFAQGVYPCSVDGEWVAVSVRDDTDWAALLDAIGRPELADDPRFAAAAARRNHHDAFDAVIAEWIGTREPDDAVRELDSRGVPAERLLSAGRMYDVAQLDARGFYQELEHPLSGLNRYPGWPFRISPGPQRHHRSASPTLGQHNREVLAGLGVPDDEIADLYDQLVIGERPIGV